MKYQEDVTAKLRRDARQIADAAIRSALPDAAVRRALAGRRFGTGKLVLVAIGKAAWQMASAACAELGGAVSGGIVITKYGHAQGDIANLKIREAGHPVPDQNSFDATAEALKMVSGLTAADTVLFLVSGGGSALFEQPLIDAETLADVTQQLLRCGADIVQINTIRKRLSAVKGGRFALRCYPAQVFSVVLSDIVGDPLDMIASGPAYPDSATAEQALAIARAYHLALSSQTWALLRAETPKALGNVETVVTGSVRHLCESAYASARALGYRAQILTDCLTCEAREAGAFLAAIARTHHAPDEPLAFITGGETVVRVTGDGRGGRNQELALSAAVGVAGLDGAALISVGSDGTDGPTDAAGGLVDGGTCAAMEARGIGPAQALARNDSYHALAAADALLITGPTGTNVNDLAVLLLAARAE